MTTMHTANTVEIPLAPKPGEIWFFIDLALIDDVPGLYALVKALGFTPRLAYRWDMENLQICLLLYHGSIPGLTEAPNELYKREQEILANAINTDAMHFCSGLHRKPQTIAA